MAFKLAPVPREIGPKELQLPALFVVLHIPRVPAIRTCVLFGHISKAPMKGA